MEESQNQSTPNSNPSLLIASSILLAALIIAGSILHTSGNLMTSANTTTTTSNTQPTTNPSATPAPTTVANLGVGNYQPKGDPNAKVKIVMFEDDRCPYCKQFMTQTEPQIIQNYVNTGKAVLYFRDYAFLGAASTLAANANGCANEQGKFWDWIDYMYQNQPDESDTSMYTNDNLTNIAGKLGMDTNKFSSCMSSNKYASQAAKDLSDGQTAGVNGTPTIFIDGTPVVGAEPYSTFQSMIDQDLGKS